MGNFLDGCKTHQGQLAAWWDQWHSVMLQLPRGINDSNQCPVRFVTKAGQSRVVAAKFGPGGPTILDACKSQDAGLAAWWDGSHAFFLELPQALTHADACVCCFLNKNGERRLVRLQVQ